MYEVNKVYIWYNQVGEFAYLNGVECTVTGPFERFTSAMTNTPEWGWPTDTAGYPPWDNRVTYAEAGDLREKNPPTGEQSIKNLFKLPELEEA